MQYLFQPETRQGNRLNPLSPRHHGQVISMNRIEMDKQYRITFREPVKSEHFNYFIKEHLSSSWKFTRQDMEEYKDNVEKVEIETITYKNHRVINKAYEKIQNPFDFQGLEYEILNPIREK